MRKPRLLDICCKGGGAGKGYAQAGFDVEGADIEPQPNYPFPFTLCDALHLDPESIARNYDAVHASPTCQGHTALKTMPSAKQHVDIIPPIRALLIATGLPYVIENVVGAPLINPLMLCGSMFGLGVDGYQLRRHRLFETNIPITAPACNHTSPVIGIYGGHARCRSAKHGGRGTVDFAGHDRPSMAARALGIDWPMTMDELSNAIPPAFTEYLGRQILAHLQRSEAA